MRVLIYFSGRLFEPKGTPIRTRNMITQLQKNGTEVFYAGHDTPDNVVPAQMLRLSHPLLRGFQLARFIRTHDIDLVYFQTSAGIWFTLFVSLFTNAKAGIDFHSRRLQEEHVYQKRSRLHTAVMESVELLLCHFVSFGTSVAGTISTYYQRVVAQMLILPVGVDTSLFAPGIEPNPDVVSWKGDAVLIAYAGNTKWYQGVEGVLETFLRLHKVHPGTFKMLVIASSGVDDVHEYAAKHNLEKAMFVLDKQPHNAIPGLLAAADILTVVRPSDMVTEYSFPSKLPEYAALGKALIVSRVSDIESYITDHVNGLVVNPDDKEALYRAFEELEDGTLRERLGKAARDLALTRFDLDVLGKELYTFLAHVSTG